MHALNFLSSFLVSSTDVVSVMLMKMKNFVAKWMQSVEDFEGEMNIGDL